MAQIGYGYGSEFQLLRFLGHHRNLFERTIKDTLHQEGEFNWLDFEFADPDSVISCDSERKGLTWLKEILNDDFLYAKIDSEYKSYKINNADAWQNWDAIFTLNGVLYLVEAKAHKNEIKSGNKKHGDNSADEILRLMREQLPDITVTEKWLYEYYQLANRLAITALINKYTPCRTLCVYFENGYSRRTVIGRDKIVEKENKNASREDFQASIDKEMAELGISEEQVSNLLAPPVFIDASPFK